MSKLVQELGKYWRKHNAINVLETQKEFGVDDNEFVWAVSENAKPNSRFIDGLFYYQPKTEAWFEEICIGSRKKRGNYEQILVDDSLNFARFRKYDKKKDSHVSMFLHNQTWANQVDKNKAINPYQGVVADTQGSVICPVLWIELDRDNEDDSIIDTTKFIARYEEIFGKVATEQDITVFVSGNRSTHIAINGYAFGLPSGQMYNVVGKGKMVCNLAHDLFADMRHDNGINDVWMLDAGELEQAMSEANVTVSADLMNIDNAIYNVNSLIRMPYTRHEKTGNQKKIIYGKQSFSKVKPYGILWTARAYEKRQGGRTTKKFDMKAPKSLIEQTLIDLFDGNIDFSMANVNGWINGLYNPFYEDGNPSVAVNIKTGAFIDFGEDDYSFDFVNIYALTYELNPAQAESEILIKKGII